MPRPPTRVCQPDTVDEAETSTSPCVVSAFRGVLPRRWVVERTFSWLLHSRRLARDYERLPSTDVALIYATMSRLMVRRLVH